MLTGFFAGSLVLGITVLCFAAWLHWNDTHGWPNESFKTELDNQYLVRRKRSRKRIHIIIAGCGVMILVAALAEAIAIYALVVALAIKFT